MNPTTAPSIRRLSCLAALLGTIAALGTCAVVIVVKTRQDALPALTIERFRAARTQWNQTGPADYDITTVVAGRQPATYSVSVRNGQVTSATRNGKPLTQPRTMGTWSVPGMFGTIEIDLDSDRRRQEDPTAQSLPQLVLQAEFDRQWGFPRRYRRIELQTQNTVSWQVESFRLTSRAGETGPMEEPEQGGD